jgi:hypothetical protein
MLVSEARELTEGSQVYLINGVGAINKDSFYDYVAGPFVDGPDNMALVVRNPKNNRIVTHNLGDLAVKPPMPAVGEEWIHRVDGYSRVRYIDGVTDKYVITKTDRWKPDSKAHLLPINDFVTRFRKKP